MERVFYNRKIRVGIDARFVTRKPLRGIGTYSVNLLAKLTAFATDIDFYLYIDCEDVDSLLPGGGNVRVRVLSPRYYGIWEQVVLPIALANDDIDLFHSLGNTAPIFLRKSVKLVVTIHDVMYLRSGDFVPVPKSLYQRFGRVYRAIAVPYIAKKADAIITISEFSKNDILRAMPEVTLKNVIPIAEAGDPGFTRDGKKFCLNSDRPFLLCLGAEDPRKNTLRVVSAFSSLCKSKEFNYDLVVCGFPNWRGSPVHRLVESHGIGERVTFLSFVTVEQLAALYRNATAFLYISLYEGFGLPILEAFACGCPVVASNTTSIPEVAGDAVVYVNPIKVGEIQAAILSIVSNPAVQYELKKRGLERSKLFSWELTARRTLDVYADVLKSLRRYRRKSGIGE